MPSETYYVRRRGRVTGPYDLANLQRLARRGELSRIHEVSIDRINWASAGNTSGIFQNQEAVDQHNGSEAGTTQAPLEIAPTVDQTTTTSPRAVGSTTRDATTEDLYYYFQGGVTIGPVPLQTLSSLTLSGELQPNDPVWRKGDEVSTLARQLLQASPAYPGTSPSALAHDGSTSMLDSPAASDGAIVMRRRMRTLSLVSGLVTAVILLFCLNVPYDNTDAGFVWWWDLLGQGTPIPLAMLFVYGLVGSLGLFFISTLVRNTARAWTYAAFSAVGLVLLMVAAMTWARSNQSLFSEVLVPTACACLFCVSFFRTTAPHGRLGPALQATVGGLVFTTTLIVAILSVWTLVTLRTGGSPAPSWIMPAILLSFFEYGCGVICGVLGIIAVRPVFSKPLNTAIIALCIIVMLAALFRGLLLGYGFWRMAGPDGTETRFLFVQVVRMIVVAYALILLIAVGLWELLICTRLRPSNPEP